MGSPRTRLLANIFVIGLAVYGISTKTFEAPEVPFFQRYVMEVFAPIQESTVSLKSKLSSLFTHYFYLVNTNQMNTELKRTVDKLHSKIFELQEVEKENLRLKKLLQFGEEIPREKVLAQVVGWDSSNEFNVLRINKGQKDGISLKSPVITVNGLVGHVFRLSHHTADILTILDQNSKVDSIVGRTRSFGVLEGLSNFKSRLKYVIRTEPVEIGDIVLTAGLGNIYPKGIKIGTITEVERESYGMTQMIRVTPSVDFLKLEEVVVLSSPYKDEASVDYAEVP